ncbi:hypothetical protein BLOT_013885 [Blomia tropicalis]|nr:hypothetical protein BLOT_013885 [Blomia tropicalis]
MIYNQIQKNTILTKFNLEIQYFMLRDFKIVQNLWCQNKNVGFTESNLFSYSLKFQVPNDNDYDSIAFLCAQFSTDYKFLLL